MWVWIIWIPPYTSITNAHSLPTGHIKHPVTPPKRLLNSIQTRPTLLNNLNHIHQQLAHIFNLTSYLVPKTTHISWYGIAPCRKWIFIWLAHSAEEHATKHVSGAQIDMDTSLPTVARKICSPAERVFTTINRLNLFLFNGKYLSGCIFYF